MSRDLYNSRMESEKFSILKFIFGNCGFMVFKESDCKVMENVRKSTLDNVTFYIRGISACILLKMNIVGIFNTE